MLSKKVFCTISIFILCITALPTHLLASNQPNSPFCGPEVLSRVYEKFGIKFSLEKINRIAEKQNGLTSLLNLIEDAKTHKLRLLAFKNGNFKTLESALRIGSVIINNNGHFSLIEKIERDKVYIYDPGFSFEHYSFPWEIFKGRWDGYGLILSKNSLRLNSTQYSYTPITSKTELNKLYGADECSNCSGIMGTYGSGYRYSINNGAPPNSSPTYSGNKTPTSRDPVHIQNGNLHLTVDDLNIPAKGLALNLTRYYNSETISEVDGWVPDGRAVGAPVGTIGCAGTWAIEDAEFSGQGNRVTSDDFWQDFTLDLDVKTITAGAQPWEVAWINFRYFDQYNRYYVLLKTDGGVELSKFQDGTQYWLTSSTSSYNPLNQNHIRIVSGGSNIKVYVNSVLKINYTDTNPLLGQGRMGLEAYFSHVHYDNVVISGESKDRTYNFDIDDNDFIFGYGWSHSYGLKIIEYPSHITLIRENNSKQIYAPNPDGSYYPVPYNSYDTLSKDASGYSLRTKYGVVYRFDLSGKLIYIEDRNANRTTLSYSSIGGKDRLTTISSAGTRAITLQYGANNLVSSATDPAGHQVIYNYNASGYLTSVQDRRGNSTQYVYDPVTRNLTQLIDKETKAYNYTYAYNDRILTQTDPLNNTTAFDYNWSTTHISNNRNELFKYNFDNNLFLQSVEDPNGYLERTQNDADGNIIDHWDRNNNNTHYTYDAKGNVASFTDAQAKTTSFVFNLDYSVPTSITNARGYTTNYTYDTKGNLTKVTDPLENETNLTYNGSGQLVSITDTRLNTTTFAYNDEGDLISKTEPYNRTTTYQYDSLGRLTQATNALGGIIAYAYDNNGNLTSLTDPLNRTTAFSYSPEGNLLTVTDAKSNTTTYTYDAFGNILTVQDAKGGIVTNTYDSANQLHLGVSNALSVQDQKLNPATAFTYDNMNRLLTTTDGQGRQHLFTYDHQGNLTVRQDARSQITNYAYDGLNRLVNIDYPAGSDVHFTLDEVGNATQIVDSLGTTGVAYDELNRPTAVSWPGAGSIQYQYDAAGNLSRMIYPSGTIVDYVYNSNNELIRVKKDSVLLVEYTYDSLGRRIKKEFPNSNPKSTFYYFDSASQLTKIRNLADIPPDDGGPGCFLKGTLITMADGSSKPIEQIKAGEQVLSFDQKSSKTVIATVIKPLVHEKDTDEYLIINGKVSVTGVHRFFRQGRWVKADKLKIGDILLKTDLSQERITLIKRMKAKEKLTVYNLEVARFHNYFAAGLLVHNRKPEIEQEGLLEEEGNPNAFAHSIKNVFDTTLLPFKIETVEADTLPALSSQFIYTYDNAGNRLTMSAPNGLHNYGYDNIYQLLGVSGAQTHNYTYDAAGNRLTADGTNYSANNLNQYSVVGASDFTYDNNGNLTSDGSKTFSYDYENRLSMVSGLSSAVYVYDAFGRRVRKTVNGVVTNYVYDGDRIIEERNGSGALVATYVYGDGIDEVLTMTRASQTYYYFYDGLGSVTDITNATGEVVESYSYDVYGVPNHTSTIGNRFYFTGREYDSESGLYYYRARHYNPVIGRFLQQDPLDLIPDINVYRYVGNNPINWIDPWGLEGKKSNVNEGDSKPAPFNWVDLTSWIFPGTNYCGWTKSGPGPIMSPLDSYCRTHDQRIKQTNTNCVNFWNKDVRNAHKDFINSWFQDYLRRKKEENAGYPYNSDNYRYLFH